MKITKVKTWKSINEDYSSFKMMSEKIDNYEPYRTWIADRYEEMRLGLRSHKMITKIYGSKTKELKKRFGSCSFVFDGEFKPKGYLLNVEHYGKEMRVLVFTAKGMGTGYEYVSGDKSLIVPFIIKLNHIKT